MSQHRHYLLTLLIGKGQRYFLSKRSINSLNVSITLLGEIRPAMPKPTSTITNKTSRAVRTSAAAVPLQHNSQDDDKSDAVLFQLLGLLGRFADEEHRVLAEY